MDRLPRLETPRLLLRPLLRADAPAVAALHGDPEVVKYLGATGEPEPSLAEAYDYIARQLGHWLMEGCGKWAVFDRYDGSFVGRVGFLCPPYEWPGLELGWTIARARWGEGLAQEAACACLDWGFGAFGATEILSIIRPENQRSIAVAERLGERLLRTETVRGKLCHIYGIGAGDWRG